MRKLLSFFALLLCVATMAQITEPTRTAVFTMGENGSQYYRIPALVETADGTLVAIADQRGSALGDLPNIISIVSKRSTNGGQTWEDMVTIAQGNSATGTTYGDAAAVYDEQTGKIITIFVGNENYGANCVGLWASNSTYPLRLYQSESSNGGQSWTTPEDITESIYNAIYGSRNSWIGGFAGSGSAVQLKKGTNAGRLMFVIAARQNSTWGGNCSNYAVYSDDNGATWNVSSAACTSGDEAKIVELENGDLLMSIKNRKDDSSNGSGYRLMARSTNQGKTWTTATVNNNLMDPACNGDVVSVTYNGTYYLMHSLPGSTTTRENVTVYLSADGGETWPIKRVIYEGYSAYSSLEVLNDGTVGILVEEGKWDGNIAGEDGFNIAYYNFNMDWLTEKVKYTASVSANTGGSATINGGTANVTIEDGSTVTLAATPSTGYTFKNWTVNGSVVSTENPYVATVTGNTQYVANFQDENALDYCTWNGNSSHSSRYLSSFTIADNNANSAQVTSIQSLRSAVYADKTAVTLTTTAGATLSFSSMAWNGEWMHGYVFIDYDNDGVFNQTVNATDTTNGELVSYNFYSSSGSSYGTNSKGTTVQNNCGVNNSNMPSWTLPTNLANGTYRLRFKIYWINTDPCVSTASGNDIATNGGCIVDMTLKIADAPSASEPSATTLALIETAYELLEGVGVGYPADAPRQTLRTAIATAEANPNAAAAGPLQTAIDNYYATTDIVMPVDGATYVLIGKGNTTASDKYLYNNSGTLSIASYTEGTTVLPESARFVCEVVDGEYKYMFRTIDGNYYMAFPSPGKNWLYNKSTTGLEATASNLTKFDVRKIVRTTRVQKDTKDMFGQIYFFGFRGNDGSTTGNAMYGSMIVKNGAWDGAGEPYSDTTPQSSAFMIVEVAPSPSETEPSATTLALIETAKSILDEVGVGFPADAPRQTLRAAIEVAEANPIASAAAPLQTAITAYYNSEDIVKPTAGCSYAMVMALTPTSLYYIYNNNGTLALSPYTLGNDFPENSLFTYRISGDKALLQSVTDSKYMAIPQPNVSWLQNNSTAGIESTVTIVSQFEVNKLVSGVNANVTATPEQLFGMVYLSGSRGYRTDNSNSEPGVIIMNSSAGFDKSNNPYCNGAFSSAIRMVEVIDATVDIEKPIVSTKPTLSIFGTEGSIRINNYSGSIKVVNILGQIVKEMNVSNNAQIKIAKGIYFVVTNEKATKVVVK